jgi:hypothetical protein
MVFLMSDWDILLNDVYRSPQFDEFHARLDTYQIYSIVWCDQESTRSTADYTYGLKLPDVSVLSGVEFSGQSTVTIASLGGNVNGSFSDGFYEISGYKVLGKTTPPGSYPYPVFEALRINDLDDPAGLQLADAVANGYILLFTEPFIRVAATAYPQVQTISRASSTNIYSLFPDVRNQQPTTTNSVFAIQVLENAKAIAFQSFDPAGKVLFDFSQLANDYPVKASDETIYFSRPIGVFSVRSDSPPELKTGAPNYKDLVSGFSLDPRKIGKVKFKANSSRTIKFACYCRNKFESHPRLEHSLDWRAGELKVIAGKYYTLPVIDIVLGTLVVDTTTRSEITNTSTPANTYPYRYLFFDNLADLFSEWLQLFAAPPVNQQVYPFANTYISTTLDETGNQTPVLTFSKSVYKFKSIVRIMAANNDLWGHGLLTNSQNQPLNNHSIFDFNHQDLLETTQLDGSYGEYMTDSPRILEIWAALEAGKYATYIDGSGTNTPRVATLGHFIEKTSSFLGYRPEPDGSIDIEKEKTVYASAVVKGDFVGGQDYHAGRFGKKGMYVKRVPNKLGANGKWEPGGIVKIHDLPQLHTELFGQTNQALNLQDSTSITIRDGSNTHNYPNQLALLSEIATGVLQHRRQIREIWASSIVTQKTVNEVLAGFGLPVVNKSLTMNGQQLPYWGIQPSQSLQKEIATATYQGGAQLGQLL